MANGALPIKQGPVDIKGAVELSSNIRLHVPTFVLSLWIKPLSTSRNTTCIVSKQEQANRPQLRMTFAPDTTNVSVVSSTDKDWGVTLNGPTLPIGVWSHVAFVNGRSDHQLFVDAVLVASVANLTLPFSSSAPLYAGSMLNDLAAANVAVMDVRMLPGAPVEGGLNCLLLYLTLTPVHGACSCCPACATPFRGCFCKPSILCSQDCSGGVGNGRCFLGSLLFVHFLDQTAQHHQRPISDPAQGFQCY